MSKRADHRVVLRACILEHDVPTHSNPCFETAASHTAVFVLQKIITNQICTFTALALNFNFVSPLHPTYFRFIRPPISPIYVG
jgi:hypothetical protein